MGAHDTLNEEGYDLIRENEDDGSITVFNRVTDEYELWVENAGFAGFVLVHDDRDHEFVRGISYTQAHGRCDRCEVLRINGVVCHETGCPRQGEER